ncbi:hypothetical protein GGX14DRAFT_401718 [Mycena pura]|uniref:Uncharacterized protein n=1 Tax=Mycena pura TaxID=153505 RepID=A0AAD6Y805_9AGAR|nr:hypothetical protein GGX14DRAFT_401718 [Mycena pura]
MELVLRSIKIKKPNFFDLVMCLKHDICAQRSGDAKKFAALGVICHQKKTKKKQINEESDGDQSRPNTPESYKEPNYPTIDLRSHASLARSEDSEVSVDLGDMPNFKNENALRKWLQLGKRKLRCLKNDYALNTEKTKTKTRGPYFKSWLCTEPALQTHGVGILGFFSRAGTLREVTEAAPPAVETMSVSSESDSGSAWGQDIETASYDHLPSGSLLSHTPTVEDEDDNDFEVGNNSAEEGSLAPSKLSRLEEDGLGDIKEILASQGRDYDDDDDGAYGDSDLPRPPSPTPTMMTPVHTEPMPTRPQVHFGPSPVRRADNTFVPTRTMPRFRCQPPSPEIVDETIKKIHTILRPPCGPHTRGFKHVDLNMVLRGRLELMLSFLRLYAASGICGWVLAFVKDETHLPHGQYGKFNVSILENEDLAQELHLHLQSLGNYISAQDVVDYMGLEEMKKRLNLKHGISLQTARRWMKRMEYRWTLEPKGMYKDSHECEDVVDYRRNTFLPKWEEYSKRTRRWTKQGGKEGKDEETQRVFVTAPNGNIMKIVVIWRHDESIFYAHDQRKIRWVHGSESAAPQAKGEGHSRMIIAFVSPDYEWAARKTIRPGGNRDGYYGNKEILEYATEMMDSLDANHSDKEHVFAYDNTTTHTARAANALSARKMPLNTPGKTNKDADGNVIHIRMRDGKYADGTTQPLYFPKGHTKAGVFKGMRVLISEHIEHSDNLPDPEGLFATRSERFMDAYRKGLDGIQATWGAKRYHGYRMVPQSILELFNRFFSKKK